MTKAPPIPEYAPAELREHVCSAVCQLDLDLPEAAKLRKTTYGGVGLAGVDVIKAKGIGVLSGYRTPSHIRDDQIDDIVISMPRFARVTVTQSHQSIRLTPGTFAFYSTRQAMSFEVAPGCSYEPFELTHVGIPGAMLRRQIPHIDTFCLHPIAVSPGAGRIMQSVIDQALNEGWALHKDQAEPFAQLLVDAIANFIKTAPELAYLNKALPSGSEKVRATAQSFITKNLSDPDLNLADIARHCGVTVRYLHTVFGACGQSVTDYIRDSRLQQCRNALQTAALSHKTVSQIAMMWGFVNQSSFGRAYKAKYGLSPNQERWPLSA